MYLNAQSIQKKIGELNLVTSEEKPDIILVTESWCNKNITNALIQLDGFELCSDLRIDREDTSNGIGGGLLVFVKNGLTILSCDVKSSFVQYCKFKLQCKSEVLTFYLVYRSPNSAPSNNDKLVELLKNIEPNSYFIGDFNYPSINWDNLTCDNKCKSFLDQCIDSNLHQLVEFPTHTKGNVLDLILTNAPDNVLGIDEVGRLGKSDHSMITLEIMCDVSKPREGQLRYLWHKMDSDKLNGSLEGVEWNKLDNLTVEEAWDTFRESVKEAVDYAVPRKPVSNSSRKAWINQPLLKLIRRKKRTWQKYKKFRNPVHLEEYKRLEKQVQQDVRRAKRKLEIKLSRKEKGNNKAFNSYLKNRLSSRPTIGPIKNEKGEVVTDDRGMASILNSYFGKVFTREEIVNIPNASQRDFSAPLEAAVFSEVEIKKLILKMKPDKAAGPDQVPVRVLQAAVDILSHPLKVIFTKSLEYGVVPQDWRDANVTPIFKKGAKNQPGNYRPVSLTSICCKLMETCLRTRIVDHLNLNNLITSNQHGFMPKRSCLTNLLEFMEDVTNTADNGSSVDIIYLDFSKAFDKVPHQRLLKKFEAHGIQGKILGWVEAWLRDRRQRVVINNTSSEWEKVLSGVPQGSVLGPVAFIIFINDLEKVVDSILSLKIFADDTKLAAVVDSPHDRQKLQHSLDNLCKWAKDWGMLFNTEKCHVMHVGQNNPKNAYTMNTATLSTINIEKDIGVMIHDSLKPSVQCTTAANRARTVLIQLSKAFHFRDKNVFIRLYTRYVRPHLEFSVQAWAPYTQHDIDALESVQMKAISMVSGLKSASYLDRLKELKMITLKARRKRFDLIQVFKIMNKIDNVRSDYWFDRTQNNSVGSVVTRARADPNNLVKKRCRHDNRKNFFSLRVVDDWNELPTAVKESVSLNRFKRNLDAYLLSAEED